LTKALRVRDQAGGEAALDGIENRTIGFALGAACNFAKTGILPVIPC